MAFFTWLTYHKRSVVIVTETANSMSLLLIDTAIYYTIADLLYMELPSGDYLASPYCIGCLSLFCGSTVAEMARICWHNLQNAVRSAVITLMNRQYISHGFWHYRLDLLPGASLQSPCLRGVRVGRQKSSAVPTPGCVRSAPCQIPGTLPAPEITQLQLQLQ